MQFNIKAKRPNYLRRFERLIREQAAQSAMATGRKLDDAAWPSRSDGAHLSELY